MLGQLDACFASSCDFLAVGKINQPWISRDWYFYPVLASCFRKDESQCQDCQGGLDEKFKPEDELLAHWSGIDMMSVHKSEWGISCCEQWNAQTKCFCIRLGEGDLHGCKCSRKLSSPHQHRFYLVSLLSCFPSISWSYQNLGHGMWSGHEAVYGEGWIEFSVIFWSYYCLLLMNSPRFIYLAQWKVPSLDCCQLFKIPFCSILSFSILSSGIPLYHIGFCE